MIALPVARAKSNRGPNGVGAGIERPRFRRFCYWKTGPPRAMQCAPKPLPDSSPGPCEREDRPYGRTPVLLAIATPDLNSAKRYLPATSVYTIGWLRWTHAVFMACGRSHFLAVSPWLHRFCGRADGDGESPGTPH